MEDLGHLINKFRVYILLGKTVCRAVTRAVVLESEHMRKANQLKHQYFTALLERHPELLRACRRRLRTSRTRAVRKAVPWDLTLEDLVLPFPHDGRCPCCGTVLGLSGPFLPDTGVIDRIVPELGYVKPNIRWFCNQCNINRGKTP